MGTLILGPTAAAEATGGQVCMGVVIDDGPNSTEQNWAAVATQSAQVAPGTSDLQALAAAGDTATQNNSGLVCAINDFPANGLENCLSTSGGQYFYWSYWEGDPYTNTWTYANDGPASHTVSAGQTYVEGWRYQDPGPDNPTATKPSVSPSAAFAQACPGVTPAPSGGSVGSGGSGGSGAAGSGGGGTAGSGGGSTPGASGSSTSATTTTSAATSSPAGTRTVAGGTVSSANGTTTTSHPSAVAKAPPGAAHGPPTSATAVGNGAKNPDGNTAFADPRRPSGSGGGDPALPVVVVGVVIALLGGLAWWRWRRRPLEE